MMRHRECGVLRQKTIPSFFGVLKLGNRMWSEAEIDERRNRFRKCTVSDRRPCYRQPRMLLLSTTGFHMRIIRISRIPVLKSSTPSLPMVSLSSSSRPNPIQGSVQAPQNASCPAASVRSFRARVAFIPLGEAAFRDVPLPRPWHRPRS